MYDSVTWAALCKTLRKLVIPESVITLIPSFHEHMRATIYSNGQLLEAIDIGCSMAPTLFNLYACLVTARWREYVADEDGVGIVWKYKLDQKLFRRYTRNAQEIQLTECQFADDVAILASTHEGAESAMATFMRMASDFGRQAGELPTQCSKGYGSLGYPPFHISIHSSRRCHY